MRAVPALFIFAGHSFSKDESKRRIDTNGQLSINPYLIDYIPRGYAGRMPAGEVKLDCSGSRYDAYYLSRESNYAFSAAQYLAQMSDRYEMFIVENPINPTGQMVDLTDIERIAQLALELGKVLVVDEAYGEYIPFSQSAINLVNRFPNVITTRSFSKGWGMAGLRLGYAVATAGGAVLENLKKLVLALNGNALARTLALCAVRGELEPGEIPFSPEEVIADKRRVLRTIERLNQTYGRTLKVAATYEMSPIMLLYCESSGKDFSLHRHLMRTGLLTMSCGTYVGLDQTCVRLMLPPTEQIDLLLELLEQCIRTLPAESLA